MNQRISRAVKKNEALKLENQTLSVKLDSLKSQNSLKGALLQNTLTSLLQAQQNSALTSMNPALQNNIYYPLTLNWTLLTYMYKTHGVIQTAIDMPVLDALRGGLDIQSGELDGDDIKEINEYLDEFGILDTVSEGEIWARLYGGGAIIINTDQDPATPLDETRIKKMELYAANRWELQSPYKLDGFGASINPWEFAAARSQEFYHFYNQKIHSSRVLTLPGKAAPYIIRWQLAGWGMSEIERMMEDFNQYIKTKNVTYELLEEAKVDVYRLKDLNSTLLTDIGTNQVQSRINVMNQLKNFQNALILDFEDEYDQKQLTFAGLAEVMKENRIGIASALRMPMTKLFGMSASGFNSGEDDIENYNAMVESEIREKIKRPIRTILKMVCSLLFGESDFDLQVGFKPLRVLSAVEEESVKSSKHARFMDLQRGGLVESEELGQMMEKENMLPIRTKMAQGLIDPQPKPIGFEEDGDDDEEGKDTGSKKTKKEKTKQ